MDKVHYCERFIELMIDLEVRHNPKVLFSTFYNHFLPLFLPLSLDLIALFKMHGALKLTQTKQALISTVYVQCICLIMVF